MKSLYMRVQIILEKIISLALTKLSIFMSNDLKQDHSWSIGARAG